MSQADRFQEYILDRRLAVGGMAEIFLAHSEGPQGFTKRVVIKRILSHLLVDGDIVEMFLDEARLVARFNHPNLVHVYGLAEDEGLYGLVMEYLDGVDLGTVVGRCHEQQRQLPIEIVAWFVTAAADGLGYAHNLTDDTGNPLNVVHRDVDPTNIVLTHDGVIKVVDFGIAKHAGRQHETEAGVLKGKYCYLSPEQCAGDSVDRRSDIFSLGATLYELLTLTRCFQRDNPHSSMSAVLSGDIRPAKMLRPDLPKDIEQVLDKMLATNRDRRYANCTEVANDLRAYVAAQGQPTRDDVTSLLEELLGRDHPTAGQRFSTGSRDTVVPVSAELAQPTVPIDATTHARLIEKSTARLNRPALASQPSSGDTSSTPTIQPQTPVPRVQTGPDTTPQLAPAAPPQPPADVSPPTSAPPTATVTGTHATAALLVAAVVAGLGLARYLSTRSSNPPGSSDAAIASGPLLDAEQPAAVGNPVAPTAPSENEAPEATPEPAVAVVPLPATPRGYFTLHSTPAMEVIIDGTSVGETPLRRHSLRTGRHVVKLRSVRHDLHRVLDVRIAPDAVTTERLVVGKGKIALLVEPWANVYLRGRKLGTTPMDTFSLYEGSHILEFRNPEVTKTPKRQRINVKAGQTHKVAVSLFD